MPERFRYDAGPMAGHQSLRTHTCGELRPEHVGQRVTLAGWVHRRRDHGHLSFFDLRDRYGITQVVTSSDEAPAAHQAGADARNEWVIQAGGLVRHRPDGTTNPDLSTGPWHNKFSGSLGGLKILAKGDSGASNVILGGGAATTCTGKCSEERR